MLRRSGVLLLLAGLLFVLSIGSVMALPGIEFNFCDRADGTRVYVRYDYKADLLSVWDAGTGDIIFEIEHFPAQYINLKAFNNDCRYLFGQADNTYAVWDTVNGGRVFANNSIPFVFAPDVSWDNPQFVAFGAYDAGKPAFYIWDLYNNRTTTLASDSPCFIRDITWFYDAQEVWGRFQCHADLVGEIRGYNLANGALIGRYPSLLDGIDVKPDDEEDDETGVDGAYKLTYELDANRNFVSVAPFYSDYVMVYRRDGTLLGNLHTFHTYLKNQAISPDGRYYVIAQNQLRVWDFTALNTNTAKPNFTWDGPERVMLDVKFVDNVTVEVTFKHGDTERWNVVTGTKVG